MFYGKAKYIETRNGENVYFTRKNNKNPIWWWIHNCNPGKKNKVFYHRRMRRGKYKMMTFRGSEWKNFTVATYGTGAELWKQHLRKNQSMSGKVDTVPGQDD